jgi:hypothetical protein
MPPQPAQRDGAFNARAVFVGRAASLQEGRIDQLDMDAAVLHRLGTGVDKSTRAYPCQSVLRANFARLVSNRPILRSSCQISTE